MEGDESRRKGQSEENTNMQFFPHQLQTVDGERREFEYLPSLPHIREGERRRLRPPPTLPPTTFVHVASHVKCRQRPALVTGPREGSWKKDQTLAPENKRGQISFPKLRILFKIQTLSHNIIQKLQAFNNMYIHNKINDDIKRR